MTATIYLEGGGRGDLGKRCREGFRKLLQKCGFRGRLPKLAARGSRNDAFDSFVTAHARAAPGDFVALLVDSEEPVADGEQPWTHLARASRWQRPARASDEQALLMTTCMETWLIADRDASKRHFGAGLSEPALPALQQLEVRSPQAVLAALAKATKDCPRDKQFAKGKVSFLVLQQVEPAILRGQLPAFQRLERILHAKLTP